MADNERQWYVCPICGQKICQFSEEAIAMEVYWKCKNCKNEIEIKINSREQQKAS
jgi:ribosomal protein L37AE/L43A